MTTILSAPPGQQAIHSASGIMLDMGMIPNSVKTVLTGGASTPFKASLSR